jgi:nucleotide-binding universal stress UspA family protein
VTVLVAVADDDLRERVLAVGVKLARAFDEPLSVVHLTRDAVADGDARRLREQVAASLADARVESTVAVEHVGRANLRPARSVGHAVADLAADVDVSHVVIGHAAVGSIRGVASGSAAFALVDDADVPVTVVPEGVEPAEGA